MIERSYDERWRIRRNARIRRKIFDLDEENESVEYDPTVKVKISVDNHDQLDLGLPNTGSVVNN